MLPGTKYKITVFPYDVEFDRYSVIFKETLLFPNYTYLTFEKPYDLIEKECSVSTVFLCKYYVFVSEQHGATFGQYGIAAFDRRR